MTTTLTHSHPTWTVSNHSALSSIDAAASQPTARWRRSVACSGSHCHTV